MHLLTNTNPIPMGGGIALQPGQYVCEDADAAQMMAMAGGGTCRLQHYSISPDVLKHEVNYDYDGLVTIMRPGRYGDLILLTPCLREIKRRWPKCTLQVCCLPHYREALMGLPYIDNFISYPMPLDTPTGLLLSLEPQASLVKREGELHMTDLFSERLGLEDIEHKKPDFFLSQEERDWAHDTYPRDRKRRVVIQVKSSTPSRDYPALRMGEVVRKLHGRDWDILFIGLPHQIEGATKPNLVNCAADKLTFRQSASVISTADVFLGPDSSMIHVAGAMGTPAVGLFSVVPWNLRTSYCPTTFVIQAKQGCDIAPCFHAPRGQMGFPQNGPCLKARKCCALDGIEPDTVIDRVEQAAHVTT